MVVLVTCKNEDDPIKNKGDRVVTTLFIDFSDAQGQLTRILLKFKLIIILVTCKNEYLSKRYWSGHNISPIINLQGFFQTLKGS